MAFETQIFWFNQFKSMLKIENSYYLYFFNETNRNILQNNRLFILSIKGSTNGENVVLIYVVVAKYVYLTNKKNTNL